MALPTLQITSNIIISNFSASLFNLRTACTVHLSRNSLLSLLTQEVSDGLESLLLTHDEANALLCTISHELSVANSSLLPLLIAPSEKLDSNLHDALQVLLARLSLNILKFDLNKRRLMS